MNKRKGALFLTLCLVLAGCGQRAETKTEMAESIGRLRSGCRGRNERRN